MKKYGPALVISILAFCLIGKTYNHHQTQRRLDRSFQQTKEALDAFDGMHKAYQEARDGWKDCLDEKNQL